MAEKAFRFDRVELRSPVRTSQGFLRVEGFVSRAGIYKYINTPEDEKNGYGKAGTVRRELRPEEEVAREEVLAQFEGASLTAQHPGQVITAKNARAFEVGTVTSARYDAPTKRVAAAMVVKDPATIAKVEKGELNELSPGYQALIVKQAGTDKRYATPDNPEGAYDVIQRDIEINHQALVSYARGGGDLRLRLDGADGAIEHRTDFGAKLTSVVDGHQHLLDPSGGMFACSDGQSGGTSWAVSEGADHGHEHAWVKNPDGTITIAMAEGHTHELLDDSRYSAPRSPRADEMQIDRSHQSAESARMPEPIKTTPMQPDEQIRLLKQQLDEKTQLVADLQGKLSTAQTRADSADALVAARNGRIVELEGQLAAGSQAMETEAIREHATRADAAEEKLRENEATREAEIQKAAEVRAKAMIMMGPEFRCDGQATRDVQATVIKKFAPNEDVSDAKSPAYIETRFDALYDDRMKTARSYANAGQALGAGPAVREVRSDSAPQSGAQQLPWRDQWKQGLEKVPG